MLYLRNLTANSHLPISQSPIGLPVWSTQCSLWDTNRVQCRLFVVEGNNFSDANPNSTVPIPFIIRLMDYVSASNSYDKEQKSFPYLKMWNVPLRVQLCPLLQLVVCDEAYRWTRPLRIKEVHSLSKCHSSWQYKRKFNLTSVHRRQQSSLSRFSRSSITCRCLVSGFTRIGQ